MMVYIESDPNYHDLSEISDFASELPYEIFGDTGRHARTTLGVTSIPKNSTVEIEMRIKIK